MYKLFLILLLLSGCYEVYDPYNVPDSSTDSEDEDSGITTDSETDSDYEQCENLFNTKLFCFDQTYTIEDIEGCVDKVSLGNEQMICMLYCLPMTTCADFNFCIENCM